MQKALRSASTRETGTSNLLGDKQLVADLEADARVLAAFEACDSIALVSSEENPTDIHMNPEGEYAMSFDPLDGSSIIGANWAVGSIFGVFPGKALKGRRGRDQCAAAYAVYGPRTVLVIARPADFRASSGTTVNIAKSMDINPLNFVVQEFTLLEKAKDPKAPASTSSEASAVDSEWVLTRNNIRLVDSKKIFAPANLRAMQENEPYQRLLTDVWMPQRYTLR